jgi:hypothetical protein
MKVVKLPYSPEYGGACLGSISELLGGSYQMLAVCHGERACLARLQSSTGWLSPKVAVCCHTTLCATFQRYSFTFCFCSDAYMSPFSSSSASVGKCGDSFQCKLPCS